jgi:hypothetical protein
MNATSVGLDIGGANLKAAFSTGAVISLPFPLWKQPEQLAPTLQELLQCHTTATADVRVTMTGELCDCFATKQSGVAAIVSAVEQSLGQRTARYWHIGRGFVPAEVACEDWQGIAAANWHALATALAHALPGNHLLIDMGSTTTDLIPLVAGRSAAIGTTDQTRFANDELLYIGAARTPLMALLPAGRYCAELFATTLDACLLLNLLQDDPTNLNTADGQPATHTFAHVRIARMVGGDGTTVLPGETRQIAELALSEAERLFSAAVACVLERPELAGTESIILAGSGVHLVQNWLHHAPLNLPHAVCLADHWGSDAAAAGPASALLRL